MLSRPPVKRRAHGEPSSATRHDCARNRSAILHAGVLPANTIVARYQACDPHERVMTIRELPDHPRYFPALRRIGITHLTRTVLRGRATAAQRRLGVVKRASVGIASDQSGGARREDRERRKNFSRRGISTRGKNDGRCRACFTGWATARPGDSLAPPHLSSRSSAPGVHG